MLSYNHTAIAYCKGIIRLNNLCLFEVSLNNSWRNKVRQTL